MHCHSSFPALCSLSAVVFHYVSSITFCHSLQAFTIYLLFYSLVIVAVYRSYVNLIWFTILSLFHAVYLFCFLYPSIHYGESRRLCPSFIFYFYLSFIAYVCSPFIIIMFIYFQSPFPINFMVFTTFNLLLQFTF